MNIQKLHEATARRFPKYWREMARFRADRESLGNWPEYCWCPMSAAMAVASRGRSDPISLIRASRHIATISALSAWRATKGIYRFRPALWRALSETDLGPIPGKLLHHLPEWCIALDLRALEVRLENDPIDTAMAFVEWDSNPPHEEELRLLLLLRNLDQPVNLPIHLGGTLQEGLERTADQALKNFSPVSQKLSSPEETADSILDFRLKASKIAQQIKPIIHAVVYLASEEPDISGRTPGQFPSRSDSIRPVRASGDTLELEYGPKSPRIWTLGEGMEKAIQDAESSIRGENHRASAPRAHIRRAHWHLYWTGKGRTIPRVLWIMPNMIGNREE